MLKWLCLYIRPKLEEFLSKLNELYEIHVYTAGTRNYANAVTDIIDPERHIFKERILSRDESGSMYYVQVMYLSFLFSVSTLLILTAKFELVGMTQKNIRRLFPCDDSMVVIIDDRADVWGWPPNLIKVRPCKCDHSNCMP